MSQRRAPPFDKNDKKYEIGSFCCLHVKYVTRILAVVFLAASIFDCIRWARKYENDAIVEMHTFLIVTLHVGIQILSFVAVVGESRTALILMMTAISAFALFFLISQLANFQENVAYYLGFFSPSILSITYSGVSIFNGVKIILVILLLAYTLMIVHFYTCYIADKDRHAIVPVVVFEKKHERTTSSMMPACPAVAAGATAVAVAAAGRERPVEEAKVTDKLVEKEIV